MSSALPQTTSSSSPSQLPSSSTPSLSSSSSSSVWPSSTATSHIGHVDLTSTLSSLVTGSSLSTQGTTSRSSTSGSSVPVIDHPNRSPVTVYSAPEHAYRPDRLATLDLIIIVIYICLLLSTSISTMIRTRKSNKRKKALAGSGGAQTNNRFLAGRKMNWFTVGLSIFASNLGSEHFIGLSGSAAANGISVAAFEMNALIILQLATWIFLPVLIVSKISTLPEYMSKRFGGKRIRTYLAVLSILLYIFTKISVNLYSGGIFLQQAIGWNLYSSAMFILVLTSIMTLTGGLKGAMVIDNLQAFVMTTGASIVSIRALVEIGGFTGLRHRYPEAVASKVPANLTHCAKPNARAFQMLRPADDRDMPWLGFLIGQTPASLWYWAADQMMVQRFLSARSLAHVQGSSVFAGYLKILPLLFMVIPGMISRCLYTDAVACIDPTECQKYCQSTVSCSNTAYPRLVLELMPLGARGIMVAAMVAALMADLCNVFNSASALFSCDIWPIFRVNPSTKEQETVGRVFVFVLVLASIMWIPAIQEMQGGQLFIYIQAVGAMFAPPIAAVYVCAVLWKPTNETGAFWALMIGFALGIFRMSLSFMFKEPSCGQTVDERPWLLKHVHYMYYAAFLFWASVGSAMLISHLTKPPANFRLIRTTFWTRFDTQVRKDDKNVFELKPATSRTQTSTPIGQTGSRTQRTASPATSNSNEALSEEASGSGLSASEPFLAIKSSQQRLFTIDEQHSPTGGAPTSTSGSNEAASGRKKRTPDLSSIVVDISKVATSSKAPDGAPGSKSARIAHQTTKRAPLHHQSSLSATAGKFLANKLGTEVNLKGAKEMVLAAASHLAGGGASNIRFHNLRGDEEDDDDDDDDDDDYDERRAINRRVGSTSRGGYKKANLDEDAAEEARCSSRGFDDDDDDDDEDDEAEDDDDNPNGHRSSKATYKCLDNSVALLLKTRFEETVLRTAVVAIFFVAFGIFVLLSLPPDSPPPELVKILIKT